jgi:hypothetical protein
MHAPIVSIGTCTLRRLELAGGIENWVPNFDGNVAAILSAIVAGCV